jgi:hypothetical protein
MSGLDERIEGLELSIEGLLRLLGGSPEERQRYWEILKGITSPAEFRLAESALVAAERQLATAQANIAAVYDAANEIQAA